MKKDEILNRIAGERYDLLFNQLVDMRTRAIVLEAALEEILEEQPGNKAMPYRQVKVGMPTFSCDTDEYEGHIMAMGSFKSLIRHFESPLEGEDFEELDIQVEAINWVAISRDPTQTTEKYDNIIMQYNTDPSSVYCNKE